MSLIKSIFAFALTIAIAGFCILNTHHIDVNWSPIHESYALPAYAIITGSLGLGFLIGVFATWINSASLRKAKRQQSKQIKTLEKELHQNTSTIKNQNPPADFFPALPNKASKNA